MPLEMIFRGDFLSNYHGRLVADTTHPHTLQQILRKKIGPFDEK